MQQVETYVSAFTDAFFGPDSGIPWWAWFVVLAAILFKIMVPARQTADEKDAALVAAVAGGKKDKKKKK